MATLPISTTSSDVKDVITTALSVLDDRELSQIPFPFRDGYVVNNMYVILFKVIEQTSVGTLSKNAKKCTRNL